MGPKTRLTLAALVVLVSTVAAAPPAAAPAPAEPAVPQELNDPAFERYIDVGLLREALADSNPPGIADCALQLLEGERVLFRKHKGLSGEKLFALAARMAARAGDKVTLDRLDRAAGALKKEGLADAVAAARLAGPSRKADAAAGIDIYKFDSESVTVYRTYADQIRTAKNLGSKAQLDQLDKDVRAVKPFPEQLKGALANMLADARSALPGEPDGEMDVLAKLSTATRAAKQFAESKVQIKNSTTAAVSFTLYGTGQAKTLKPGEVGSYSVRLEGYWTPRTPESEKVPYAIYNNVKTLLYGEGWQAQGKAHAGKYEFVGDPRQTVLKESNF